MDNHTSKENEIILTLTKAGQSYSIHISAEDAIESTFNWNVIVGRNGHVYAHRTEKGKKVYLSRSIMERVLGRGLVKGESVCRIVPGSLDRTRDNLRLNTSKKLQHERGTLKED